MTAKNAKTKTKALKKAFLETMIKTFGNVTASCKAVGISRQTPYDWADNDPEFSKLFKDGIFEEMLLDAVDAKLAKLAVQDENPTVLIFLAKTKGKKRGYIERVDTDITSGGKTIRITLPGPDEQ